MGGNRKRLLIILAVGLLAGLSAWGYYAKINKPAVPTPVPTTQTDNSTPHPEPALANLVTIEGTISAISKESLSINSKEGQLKLNLDKLLDVGRVSATRSGEIIKATIDDLKIGQKVSITALKDSNSARIIIIKP